MTNKNNYITGYIKTLDERKKKLIIIIYKSMSSINFIKKLIIRNLQMPRNFRDS